jgi:hypothetical protein
LLRLTTTTSTTANNNNIQKQLLTIPHMSKRGQAPTKNSKPLKPNFTIISTIIAVRWNLPVMKFTEAFAC